ncbi:MAG TPA: pirin family protein [Steroidobacteraceae bacterium]|nr:pirin family protein [Steroidobacteraceae bacterium]
MSVLPDLEPATAPCPGTPELAAVIDARTRDLGGFTVGRVLPSTARKLIGPFIFFDHMGPAVFTPGRGIDVRPHPHIGLATVTYLFEGEIVHRDNLGSHQPIRPGDVNWMTAGRGIAHSERTGPGPRQAGSRLDGLQLWVALPLQHEETAPEFHHHPARDLPSLAVAGAQVRVLAGAAYGVTSPVRTLSPLFHVDAALPAGCELPLPSEHEERAAYIVSGVIECGNERAEHGRMLVFTPGAPVALRAVSDARVALIGGAPIDGERHLFWNFVSSSRARIEQAKRDWREGRFARVPGDEQEFIPLPD